MTILYNDQYMYYVTEVTMCTTGVDVGACHWIIQHVVDTCGCMTSFLCLDFNSLIPGRCGSNFKSVISEHFHELFFVKMFWDECLRTYLMIYKSTLVQMLVMACCRQVITANKLLLEPKLTHIYDTISYGISGLQWINTPMHCETYKSGHTDFAVYWDRWSSTCSNTGRVNMICKELTNVYLASVKSTDIHLRAILQRDTSAINHCISLKTTSLKFHSNLPEVNELSV